MKDFSEIEVSIALRKFSDLAKDVLHSDHRGFDGFFSAFMYHCEENPIISIITKPLKESKHPKTNFDSWYNNFLSTGGSFIGSKRYDRPVDEEVRLSLWYKFFIKLENEEIDLGEFAIHAFGKTNYNEMVKDFNSHFFSNWIRDIGYRLEELGHRISGMKEISPQSLSIFNVQHLNVTNVKGDKNVTAVDSSTITQDQHQLDKNFIKEVVEILRSNNEIDLADKVDSITQNTNPTEIVSVLSDALEHQPNLKEKFSKFVHSASASATGSLIAAGVKLILMSL